MIKHNIIRNNQSSSDWADGYPLGNGRLGAMVVGDICCDRIALNHDLLWRRTIGYKPFGTFRDIDEIKKLCREKRFAEAETVMSRTVPLTGQTLYINPFVPQVTCISAFITRNLQKITRERWIYPEH